MESVKKVLDRYSWMLYMLLVIAALNLGIIGLTSTDVLAQVFSNETMLNVVYVVIGIAGVLSLNEAMNRLKRH